MGSKFIRDPIRFAATIVTMAAVYKSLSKSGGTRANGVADPISRKNKQRVLILSSRGVTYRYERHRRSSRTYPDRAPADIDTC